MASQMLSLFQRMRALKRVGGSRQASPAPAGPRFVLERQSTGRLGYELLLEIDGRFRSFTMTRMPSLDPLSRRLAVRRHEADRDSDETNTRAGAGRSSLWDEGTWDSDGDAARDLAAGALKFTLHGRRLRGGFSLVRLPRKANELRENWLLIKKQNPPDREHGIAAWLTGITSPRPSKGRAAALRNRHRSGGRHRNGAAKRSSAPKLRTGAKAGARGRPAAIPQLATLAERPPAGDDWLHEVKFDGYRILADLQGKHVKLISRSGGDWTRKFEALVPSLERIRARSALLDGEVVVLGAEGRSNFGALQAYLREGGSEISYCVFDLLELDGQDLRELPLVERKTRLEALLARARLPIRYSAHIEGGGPDVLQEACRIGLEGIVSKRCDSPYRPGRQSSWIKTKCLGRDEFIIVGFRPSDKRGRPFASLLLGEYEGRHLRYRGRVGTGFDEKGSQRLADRLNRLLRKGPALDGVPREVARDARWVEPRIVAEISYTERTSDGVLRHPVFLGLREDKPAREVQRQFALKVTRTNGG